MNDLIMLLAICALYYFISNLSGPFNIFGIIRNHLMTNKLVGVFFYKLLSCPWCLGFHCGYLVYLLGFIKFSFFHLVLWALAGSAISYFLDNFVNRNQN